MLLSAFLQGAVKRGDKKKLLAAGHVVESREYACDRAADPFSLPRALREVALGRSGANLDDVDAFPNAKLAKLR